jgi:hypothetical protein
LIINLRIGHRAVFVVANWRTRQAIPRTTKALGVSMKHLPPGSIAVKVATFQNKTKSVARVLGFEP